MDIYLVVTGTPMPMTYRKKHTSAIMGLLAAARHGLTGKYQNLNRAMLELGLGFDEVRY
jgi:hypothetical protein